MQLNKESLEALNTFYKIILSLNITAIKNIVDEITDESKKQLIRKHTISARNIGNPSTNTTLQPPNYITLKDIKTGQNLMSDTVNYLTTSRDYLLTITTPTGIIQPVDDFAKFYHSITLIFYYIGTDFFPIERPKNEKGIISRIIGIAIKSTVKLFGEQKETFPNHELLNQLASLFTDNGTIPPENKDRIPEATKNLVELLSAKQVKKNGSLTITYQTNEKGLEEYCKKILYTAITNYENDKKHSQHQESAKKLGPKYTFKGMYSESVQQVLDVLRACYNERTNEVTELPACSCPDLIVGLMSLKETILNSKEKYKIKTGLEAGARNFIQRNELPQIFYYLSAEERYIYQIATLIDEKLPKTIGESCTITIKLPTATEEQAQEPTKLELTQETCACFRNQVKDLHDANDFINSEKDENKDDTFEILSETIERALTTIKILLEGHGISITPPQPATKNTKRKNKT